MRMTTQYVDDNDANGAVSQTRVVTGHLRTSASLAKTVWWNVSLTMEKGQFFLRSDDEKKGQRTAIVFFLLAPFFHHFPSFAPFFPSKPKNDIYDEKKAT